MVFPREKISASLLNLYLDCPKAFKLTVIDGFLPPEGPALQIGSMFDLMFKSFHTGVDPYKATLEKYNLSDELTKKNYEIARSLMESYKTKPFSFKNPKFDIGFKIPIKNIRTGEELPYFLTGWLDGEEEDGTIIEAKTTSADYTQEQVDDAIQGSIYAYYKWFTSGSIPPIKYVVFNKKTKKQQLINTRRTKDDLYMLFNIIKQFIKDVEDEKFDRNPGHSFWCPCRKL